MTLQADRPRRLVFAGEAIVDVLMRVPGLPPRGGDLLATSAEVTVGGGFNVMAAAARQGLPVLYAGGHGTGPWGDLVRAALAAENIGLLRPPDPTADTGFDVALVEPDAERTFITMLGAESASEPGSWATVPVGPGDVVYISGYGLVPPASGPALAAWAAALPPDVLLFVDPGPLVAQIPANLLNPVLARCDWLSCNAREAALLTAAPTPKQPALRPPTDPSAQERPTPRADPGAEEAPTTPRADPSAEEPPTTPRADPSAQEAALRLLARTARANVIVRVGPDGCYLATRPPATTPPPGPQPTPTPPSPQSAPTSPGLQPAPAPPSPQSAATPPGPDPTAAPLTPESTSTAPGFQPAPAPPGPQSATATLAPLATTAPVHIPAPPVHAVDSTGAGDAHSGVFLAALADGLHAADAARRANAAAALAVTRPGPATSPDRAELDAWLAQR